MISCTCIGRLGRDIEVSYNNSGMAFGKTSLACKLQRKDPKTNQMMTEWVNLTFIDKAAENASKFLKKGDKCCVSGHLQTDEFTGTDGQQKKTTKLVVSSWESLESNPNANQDNQGQGQFNQNQGQPQFNQNQGQPQFNQNQGQPQFNPNQGQPQFNPNQGQPQFNPNQPMGQPQFNPNQPMGQGQPFSQNQGQPVGTPNMVANDDVPF